MESDFNPADFPRLTQAARQRWPRLTDEDIRIAKGSATELARRVNETYGLPANDAERLLRRLWSRETRRNAGTGGLDSPGANTE